MSIFLIKLLIGNIYQFLEMQKIMVKNYNIECVGKLFIWILRHTEESYMLTCKIVPRETYDTFGILLKSDKEASGCLFLEFDKAMQRVSFLNLPMGVDPFWVQSCQAVPPATEPGPDGVRVCEKTMQIEDGKAIDVKIIVDHDMIEAFIDEQIAFTYRIYAKPEFETGIIAQDSNVEFYNLSISGK